MELFVLLQMRGLIFPAICRGHIHPEIHIGGTKLRHQLKSEVEYDRKSAEKNQGSEAGGAGV